MHPYSYYRFTQEPRLASVHSHVPPEGLVPPPAGDDAAPLGFLDNVTQPQHDVETPPEIAAPADPGKLTGDFETRLQSTRSLSAGDCT